MQFSHSPEIWTAYPELAAGVLLARGLPRLAAAPDLARFHAMAEARLGQGSESELPEIQAWRRVFSRMGLKPTQYRCASEALLRRFRKEKTLPSLHPLVDLCNAVSLAFAVPVAALDLAHISGDLQVRPASGTETYLAFSGETEHPEPGEVVFADAGGNAHARRWTNRQSGLSAVRADTSDVLIVCEAVHATARADMERLVATLADAIAAAWSVTPRTALLSASSPVFAF